MGQEVKNHYDAHLYKYYDFIHGGRESSLIKAREFFNRNSITPSPTKGAVAIDLGCGSGFQTIPLAEGGYHVVGIDISQKLLDEVRNLSASYDIETINGDILDFKLYADRQADLVTCMGDTLSHLNDLNSIQLLLWKVAKQVLRPKGRLVLSFRDLTVEPPNSERFVPVRSEENLIFTCILEYHEMRVRVSDLVYERVSPSSPWEKNVSSYFKTRIDHTQLKSFLREVGLKITFDSLENGVVTIIAEKST
mmetsp:Transcript_15452/g.25545  ORF Transcript_15452/g.25545 Transcript_15452/m.25545 type:complete len:250 (+) Transcript_15452:70-819(+)|eukprot:CAMPEP_0184654984 /NCGR_PEP_ID=MMETSP0308-20130426/12628_1 /TAXON_ID=38269 /ORGANISM="Gloeochaete witrockiana, Strain SAG 46.84" /LENGTH=249 /DNA_ID=CAMNT_0027091217 /DNA_START=38 /DNA_END=787 /DNA_ORIENTATION=+